MKIPLCLNSWNKLAWWIAYTTVVLAMLTVTALYLSMMAWAAAPFLFLLGYYLQSYCIHKNMLSPQNPSKASLEELVASPKILDQNAYNLCGPASILYALLYARPDDFTRFARSFRDDPRNVGLSLPTRTRKEFDNLPIDLAIMMALKHKFNLTGYHPITRSVEKIQGASFPKQMVEFMLFFENYLGITITRPEENRRIIETTTLHNTYGQPLAGYHQALLGGVYSKEHYTPPNLSNHISYLHDWSQSEASIMMLIDMNLCLKILGEDSSEIKLSLAGVEFSHYVYLNNLSFDKTRNTVTIKISTWGVCAERTLPYDTFAEGFRGFIAWEGVPRPRRDTPPPDDRSTCRRAAEHIQAYVLPHKVNNPNTLFSCQETPSQITKKEHREEAMCRC
ncbi:MAG: hypothetical protein ACOYKA_03020 [Legionellaceae bacterium]